MSCSMGARVRGTTAEICRRDRTGLWHPEESVPFPTPTRSEGISLPRSLEAHAPRSLGRPLEGDHPSVGSTQEPDDTDLRPKDVANDRAQLVRPELATQDPQASTVDRDLEWRQPLLARELAGEGRKRVRSRAPGIDAHVLDRLLPADLDPQALSTLGLF